MKVTPISCGPAVNESERKAIAQLKTRLISEQRDGEWLLLTNLTFSATHHLQSDEIDIIAIGPPGVRVIEVKHWTAQWINRRSDLVEQEAERVTNKARKIGTTLRKEVPNLRHVDGVFLLTEELSKVKGITGKVVRGVPFCTLQEWQPAVGLDLPPVLSRKQITTLGAALTPKTRVAVDGTLPLRRLAGYVNLELQTPKDLQFHRVYKGTRSGTQDRVVLHFYDLSAGETNAEAKARREFEALHRLQRYDWAPRILDSFQEAPGYAGEVFFFTVVDPAAPSMERRKADVSWETTARLTFARNAMQALAELHEAGMDDSPMIHRNLTPRAILVKHDNAPIFTDFELSKIPSDITVASTGVPDGGWSPETAPEVCKQGLGAADHRSDVYSLCACLTELFRDRGDETSQQVVESLVNGLANDPEIRRELEGLESELAKLLGESPPQPPPPPARFWTEEQIVPFQGRAYRVVARLGSGGVGTTFKVVEIDPSTQEDRGTYVAKVAHNPDTGCRTVQAYSLARSHLGRHPAVSAILEVAPEWRENEFTALMTWVEGSPLRDFIGVFPLLAEEYDEGCSETLVLRWLREMCEALGVLHRNGLVHGDVSPSNMIVSNGDLVLTDYDFVVKFGEQAGSPGTVMYCSSSYLEGRPAAPADDFYALAASFFHVLFEKEPFMYDGSQAKERGLNWVGVEREDYPTVTAFLAQATDPDPEQRFKSVAEAKAALNLPNRTDVKELDEIVESSDSDTTEPPLEPAVRRENEVSWLQSLLQSYPGSRWGNSETRGLDTDFAERTYVETKLEEALYRDVLSRKVRLVILCGNAGDGKTALLQHLAGRLGFGIHDSSKRILEKQMDDSLVIRMNLDGSASWQGRSADELLDKFLEPFQKGSPDEDIVHLLAINDGRLLEWIDRVESETPLIQALYHLLNGEESSSESHIRFISLNQRSLVGSVVPSESNIETSFLEDLLDSLYGKEKAPQIWAPCDTCSAQDRCEVRRAMRRFGPQAPKDARARARQRLFEMLQAVHLRGETHITVRELRATLVYILFGVHFCRDYHNGADVSLPYWDRAFSPESPGRQGEVLQELIRFDPALEAHPQIDRHLLRTPSIDTSRGVPHYPGLTLRSARRRAYFEWTEDNIAMLAVDPHTLDLAQARHYREFRSLTIVEADLDDLCRRLCEGISRLESLPPQAFDRPGVVPLRITPRTPTETAFWVEKSLTNFRLEADLPAEAEGLDRLHRQAFLIYRYRDGGEERLRLGAELFYLLMELSDGYQLGDVSTDDTFAHLSIFVQRLVREDDHRMLAWNPMRDEAIYEISAEIIESDSTDVHQQMIIRRLEEIINGR